MGMWFLRCFIIRWRFVVSVYFDYVNSDVNLLIFCVWK